MTIDGDRDDDLEIDLEDVPEDQVDDPADDDIEPSVGARAGGADVESDDDDEIAVRPSRGDDDDFSSGSAGEEAGRQAQAQAALTMAEAHAMVAEQQMQTARVAAETVEGKINDLYAALAQARDSGDTSAEINLQRALEEARTIKQQIAAGISNIPDPRRIMADGQARANHIASQPTQGRRVGAGIQAKNPIAARWASQNSWMRTNGEANEYVIAQSKAMSREGWDGNSPSFYHELSRRIRGAFPALKVSALQATQKAPGKNARPRSNVAPATSSSGIAKPGASAQSKSRYTLTATDQAAMRRMRLDPANKQHCLYFAKSRIETARSGKEFR